MGGGGANRRIGIFSALLPLRHCSQFEFELEHVRPGAGGGSDWLC